jgi:sporulation integral membrane protein YtvI
MLSFYKKYYKTVFDIALIVLTVYIFMLLFSYLYRIATPIFLAFLIFAAIEPLAKLLHCKGLRKSIASGISILLFVIVILGALVGIGVIFTNQIINLSQKLPDYSVTLQEQIAQAADYLHTKWNALPAGVADKSKEYAANITSFGAKLGQGFLIWLVAWLTSFSSFVVNFTIGIILAYFLSTEIDTWKQMAHSRTPKTFKTAFFFLKENVFIGILGYLKAQFKMVLITFAVILIVLIVLGVPNAFSISLLAGALDLLPLLGVSTVFIPWIIYLFIVGQTPLAIELSVLLGLVILVRQILEPKITGDTLGVSAFTMLSAMIISLSIFGVSGLILSPILIILLKALYDQGYLSRWIRLPEDYDHHI